MEKPYTIFINRYLENTIVGNQMLENQSLVDIFRFISKEISSNSIGNTKGYFNITNGNHSLKSQQFIHDCLFVDGFKLPIQLAIAQFLMLTN